MLRLRDARTGELTDVLPAGRRQLRILVSAQGQPRAYLTADLVRRAAEKFKLLPLVTDLVPAGTDNAALRAACDALNVHPPRDTLTGDAADLSGVAPFDVGITVGTGTATPAMARLWITVSTGETRVPLGDEALPVRLVLLGNRYDAAVTASDEEISAAARALGRWRRLVAEWARSGSEAMARPYADTVNEAFGCDLDTPAALKALAALADDMDVPAGAKFETFAASDMLLGLDLARDIGRE